MLNHNDPIATGERPIALLDIGTIKVCCLIAAVPTSPGRGRGAIPAPPRAPRVLSLANQRSLGIKAGVVVNLEDAEQAVRAAVSHAERQASVQVEDVVVAIACGRLKSANFTASADIHNDVVNEPDIDRMLAGARCFAERDGRTLVHMNRIGYRIDGAGGIGNPVGMAGRQLSSDVHAVTADEAPLRNMLLAVERAHLTATGLVAAPFASAMAVTTAEERRLGVTCIDMGGGTTTLAVFAEGHFLFTDAVAIGGNHITFDIARGLSTPLAEAERIKTLYGNVVGAYSDEHELISYPAMGEEGGGLHQISRARLRSMIRPRVEEILGLLQERLERSGFDRYAGSRVVITGGGSQLAGLAEVAAARLGRATRIGRPLPMAGPAQGMCSPAFAAAVGLLHAISVPEAGVRAYEDRRVLATGTGGYLGRMSGWLRENF